MKRRYITGLAGLALGMSLVTGCAKTPEESLVKQKGEASLKNYEEGETLGGGEASSGQEETEQLSDLEKSSEGQKEEQASGKNVLRAALNAPEHYKSELTDETGKLRILTDAEVEIPNAKKVSAIGVSQHPFNQELMDKVSATFFPGAKFYTDASYSEMDKEYYRKKIEILKGYVADGNLDPYDYGYEEDGSLHYDIYKVIEQMEKDYLEAPETKTLVEVHPQYGIKYVEKDGSIFVDTNSFYGVAFMEDGKKYHYTMKTYGAMPMSIEIRRVDDILDMEGGAFWSDYDALNGSSEDVVTEEEMKEKLGISYEDAKALADEKVALLELPHMEMTDWEYGIMWEGSGSYSKEKTTDYCYQFHYTRKINEIPITYTMSWGGALEDMDSEMETWGYEILNIYVTKDGIHTVEFMNQYDIGEVKTENLNLMPFEEIIKIYEKMMIIQNADVLNQENYRDYRVDRITFGYSRIYEPSTSSQTGILVPVWDFFGSFSCGSEYEGVQYDHTNSAKYQSYLTINAVDGSIINRELGY